MTNDCQVLIVGAGPTGLVLACELLARGIRARIIDKGDGAALETRALGIHARTLEVFDMMGLAGRFVGHGQVVRRFHMYTDGKTLVRLELGRNGSAFGFMLDVPQDVTETLLRQRITELGGRVEQGTELSGLSADSGGVTATVCEPGGVVRAVTADYLVGADGAHSRVRSELGLEFRGHPYTQDWLLADVHLDWDRPEDEMHAFFRRDGRPLICMPMREHRWRVTSPSPESVTGGRLRWRRSSGWSASGTEAGAGIRSVLAGYLPVPAALHPHLPARARPAGRRRRAHSQSGRRAGHEHRHHGRA